MRRLKKFHKSYFDVDTIISTASELKYTGELKLLIQQEMASPSDALVRHFSRQVYAGTLTAKMMEYFTGLVKKSFQQTFSDQITGRLKTALEHEEIVAPQAVTVDTPAPTISDEKKEPNIVTTQEELEGFYIVRAILRNVVDANRIVHRDAQSYFAILLDNNNRKPICRLHLNGSKKAITIFDENRVEQKHEMSSINDIFLHSDTLIKALAAYEKTVVSDK